MSMIKRNHTFTIDHTVEFEKKNYSGKFTTRVASFADKTRINVRTAHILGGMYCVRDEEGNPTGRGVDPVSEHNARMMAWLETVLIQKPDWFKLEDTDSGIIDEELIFKVFKEVMKYERTFRGDDGETTQADDGSVQSSEGVGAEEPAQAVAGNSPTPVVGSKVQAALDA